MDAQCQKCGTHVAMDGPRPWKFCPLCGTAVAHESHPVEHEHHPAKGAFGGMFYGAIAAPILIFPGILLCLLGWGIFLGIPMILLGVAMPFAGPMFGMGEHRGKCPACGTRMVSVEDGKKHSCPVCNEKFAMEDQHTVAAG